MEENIGKNFYNKVLNIGRVLTPLLKSVEKNK